MWRPSIAFAVSITSEMFTQNRNRRLTRPESAVEANGEEDHGFAMDAVDRSGPLVQEAFHQEVLKAQAQRATARVRRPPQV